MRQRHSERGSVLIVVALSTVAMLGVAALSLDASFMFDLRNRMSAVADSAALSAAREANRGNGANIGVFADQAVGWARAARNIPDTVQIEHVLLCTDAAATCTAPYNTNRFVEVILTADQPTFFGNILGFSFLRPRARSVAGSASPDNCLIITNDAHIGKSTLTLNGCGMAVGHDLYDEHTLATVTGTPMPDVSVTVDCVGTCDGMGNLTEGQPFPNDPLRGLAAPTVTGTCAVAAADPLPPGCYTDIPGSIHTLTGGGIYKITGTVDITSAVGLTGSNLLVYLTSTAKIELGNNGLLSLSASDTIAGYQGIAIYGEMGSIIHSNNHPTVSITGVVYMPEGDLDFRNHLDLADTGCTLFIARNFWTDNGDGQFFRTDTCGSSFSHANYLGTALAE